jgi:hypothetical protein
VHVDFEHEDGVESLRGLVVLAQRNAATPGVVELYTTLSAEATSPDHPAHSYFVARYDDVRRSVTASFERIAESGRLAPGVDPYRAAVATIALMDGLQVQWLLDPEAVDMPRIVNRTLDEIVDPTSTDMASALTGFFRGLISGFDMTALESVLDARAGTLAD